ncbi:MAG: hypothetical protein ACREGF_00605, partial [Candidatus Saccharimonadales bacterium]
MTTTEASGNQAPRDLEPIIDNLGQLATNLRYAEAAYDAASAALETTSQELDAAETDYNSESQAAIHKIRELNASGKLDGEALFGLVGRIAGAAGESIRLAQEYESARSIKERLVPGTLVMPLDSYYGKYRNACRLAQAPDGAADVTPILDLRFEGNIEFSFAAWQDNGNEAPASQIEVGYNSAIGADEIKATLDEEAKEFDLASRRVDGSSLFGSARFLAANYEAIGLADQAAKFKDAAIKAAERLVGENTKDYSLTEAIS